ncbi:MAG: TetR family transcriptional regulator [Jatrophihabitantaceae bacterium]
MASSDPLFDTLFRSTARAPAIVSGAPVRAVGTRVRAGNTMSRTRNALLGGARRAATDSGTKITMAQVAAAAGVAKATLYNHFRTRDSVLSALLAHEVTSLVDELADVPLPQALAAAAEAVARHPVLRTLARIEPATIAALGCVDTGAEGWRLAHDAVATTLARHRRGGTETVLRWLASYLLTPAGPAAVAADVAVLLAGLPGAQPAATATSAESAARSA